MNGHDHKGFAVAGSATITSIVYKLTPTATGDAANILHPTGVPWTWRYFANGVHIDSVTTIVAKIIFYSVVIALASIPDQLEKRKEGDAGLPVKHRGCTHSCLFLGVSIGLSALCSIFGWSWLLSHHIVLAPFVTQLLTTTVVACFLAIITHMIADGLTKEGVRVFWPDETFIGVLPKEVRFTNESMGPSVFLWSLYFVIGILFTLGVVGP